MKKTALYQILLGFLIVFSLYSRVSAQSSFEGGNFGIGVNANINQDLYSQLTVFPNTVEAFEPSQVSVRVLDSNNTSRPFRSIILYINGDSSGTTISQPPLTDTYGETSGSVRSSIPGTYEICAKDTTDGFDIFILDCETIYVTPVAVPTILPEPQYTKGSVNTISWSITGSNTYTYTTQISKSASFNPVLQNIGWIPEQSYQFTGLQNGQIYFYRVKAKNVFGAESTWSNYVFSVQDSIAPQITFLSISGIGSNTKQTWEAQDILTIKLRISDNVGIGTKSFWCTKQNGDSDSNCINSESLVSNIWEIKVKLGDLEQDPNYNLFAKYSFCAEVSDLVGNVTRNCNISINIPDQGTPPIPPKPPIIEKVKDKINEVINNAKEVVDNTVGLLRQEELQNLTVTTAVVNISVGIGVLIGGLGTIPYIILQIFLTLSSLFGFRKKGHPTGYVYDSVTKSPIPQAIVRVFNENNELVWTDVTDTNGYFKTDDFESAEYMLKITAKDHTFPSKIVFGKTDFPLENVYHGEEFFAFGGNIPNYSVPMDLIEMSKMKRYWERFISSTKIVWKFLHTILFLVGLIFSIYALYTNMIWYNYVIVFLYLPSLFMLVLTFFNQKDRYGIVRDIKGKRLGGIVVGLKDPEFDRLVSKRVTDSNGRYRFLIEKGTYDIVILSSEWVMVDTKKFTGIKVKRGEGEILAPNIKVMRMEEKELIKEERVKKRYKERLKEDILEPLDDL